MIAARSDIADLDDGAKRAGPERMCIVTRDVRPIAELIRFVVGPDNALVPDIKNRLPGRGVWVTARRDVLDQAVKRGAFAKSLKRAIPLAEGLADATEALLAQSALDALGIAYKSRLVAPGFTKAEKALESGEARGLLQAAEAAPDGVRKLKSAARRGDTENVPVLIFAGSQLDLALGRANVIHAALLAGSASETLLARYVRLEGFQGGESAKLAEDK
ncbi:hypothetical protein GJW-30_1_02377 [Variibacter gotjawalensis]|uniref:YlxR domain-containing protein n=1 Tax=Variibacter gotjawalensis TaxID=1333996 RepID=A0A0S3PVA6_9BRAD|nr:RNA-binding protein [Variibacter gotjawalensis]NIK50170.1 hypothetical protein [Variibacter gotjawalensis]RZS46167.1 hypothetical protein EV661_4498 [Variibacter gotjawalensis]BAT59842.1 hypothetical protein GJW-30_1_02377 [Variibacter gotjawalensis]